MDNEVLEKLEKIAKEKRKKLSELLQEIVQTYLEKGDYGEKVD
jgi:metal-responsive CopG/Arc/MetJ family transcriptional regulator